VARTAHDDDDIYQVTPPEYGSSASFFPEDPTLEQKEGETHSTGALSDMDKDTPSASSDFLRDRSDTTSDVLSAKTTSSVADSAEPVRFHL